MMHVVALAGVLSIASAAVTVTPWCANSVRVQVTDAATDSVDVAMRRSELRAKLDSEKLKELPGALIDKCGPGAPVVIGTADSATAVTNGNLEVVATQGALTVTAKDTGKVLFTATTKFSTPAPPPPPPPVPAGICSAAEKGMDQVGGKVIGSLKNQTPAQCCAACVKNPQCDAWIQGSKESPVGANGCFFVSGPTGKKAATDRTVGFVRNASHHAGGGSAPIPAGFKALEFKMTAGDKDERIYGLGQGNWTCNGGCASGCQQVVVPLERNGQTIELLQRKFHVTIPYAYSTAGYGFVFNMPGYGHVIVGEKGAGGMDWRADAALDLDIWISALPAGTTAGSAAPIYAQYADATGHAPMLRDDAMIFWQSRNRYKSSAIALSVASHYEQLKLPVGVIVIDYKNQHYDGDFQPGLDCFPSVKELSDGIREKINATTVFSFWPEVKTQAKEYGPLKAAGCLINSDLGGLAIDATVNSCRAMIWSQYLKPRYYDQGVTSYWLDETDGEGTAGGDVPDRDCDMRINDCGGYQTSFGPAAAYSNLWVNQWLAMYTDPVTALGADLPLALTRGVWAGGQRHGIVLWSSDIESTYEELTAQLNLGVHASLSGIPWWTTDVGGYGCGSEQDNESPYMKELIVRWYQFGCFSPVMRTHGHRKGADEPNVGKCQPRQSSGGPNEVWSYGADTQVHLEKYIRLRAEMKPYVKQLALNVTATGVPTVRPLWWEFPQDVACVGVETQYMFGPDYLVAPVTTQGTRSRTVYFPAGVSWKNIFNASEVVTGGVSKTVPAPLDIIPVYKRM